MIYAATGEQIAQVHAATPAIVEEALSTAKAAQKAWAKTTGTERGRILRRAADMVEIIDRSAEVMLGCYALRKDPPTLPPEVVERLQKIGDILA